MIISKNKLAYFDYKISKTFEAGLILSGPEVKSVKKAQIDLKGSYITIDKNMEAWLINSYIAPYKPAKSVQDKYNTNQDRKLLLTKKELKFLFGKSKEAGISILPLKVFVKNRMIKLEIGVGVGKKKHDKREDKKKKDFKKSKQIALKY